MMNRVFVEEMWDLDSCMYSHFMIINPILYGLKMIRITLLFP